MGPRIALALLAASGCGRIGFDSSGADGSTGSGVAWVKTFVAHTKSGTTDDSFMAQAVHPNDAIVMHVECDNATIPASVTANAPGWTFVQLGPTVGTARKIA